MRVSRGMRLSLRTVALGYLLLLLALPVGFVFYKTFDKGLGAVWDALASASAISALKLTLLMVAVAVPLNTAFGVLAALVIVRGRVRGKALLNALIDLPFAISPVVVGLALYLLYGIVLTTARVLGEFGAVSVVSGKILGQTDTLPIYVQNRFEAFDLTGAYAASALLAVIALATLLLMTRLQPKEART